MVTFQAVCAGYGSIGIFVHLWIKWPCGTDSKGFSRRPRLIWSEKRSRDIALQRNGQTDILLGKSGRQKTERGGSSSSPMKDDRDSHQQPSPLSKQSAKSPAQVHILQRRLNAKVIFSMNWLRKLPGQHIYSRNKGRP